MFILVVIIVIIIKIPNHWDAIPRPGLNKPGFANEQGVSCFYYSSSVVTVIKLRIGRCERNMERNEKCTQYSDREVPGKETTRKTVVNRRILQSFWKKRMLSLG